MNLFSSRTFKGKLSALIVMTTGLALLIAVFAFTLNDNISVKKSIQTRLETQAKIFADTSVTALLFHDQKASEEILASLEADQSIVQAAIYDVDGSRYATYTTGTVITLPNQFSSLALKADKSYQNLHLPIHYNGKEIGQVVIVASTEEQTQRIIYFITTALFILLVALLLSFLITGRLQNEILLPITLSLILHHVLGMRKITIYGLKYKRRMSWVAWVSCLMACSRKSKREITI